ncbi:MAG: serine/threonine-protein kinase [Planctomycetota bacterium]
MPSLPEIAEQMRMDRDAGQLAAVATYQAQLPEQALALAAIHAHLAASLRAPPEASTGSTLEQASRSVVGLDTLTDPEHARHTIQGEIARGGMGVVFAARDEILRRDLAVKKVVSDTVPGTQATPTTATPVERLPMLVRRLMEEAQVTAQLDHSGVVPVHELGVDDEGHVYFTMKRVRGRTLAEVFDLVREGRSGWTLGRALHTFLKICETLAYAHGKGVIHRDLKPANVMVGTYGEVFVMDWGLAKVRGDAPASREPEPDKGAPRGAPRSVVLTDQAELARLHHEVALTLDGDVVGTLGYMPPEQARGDLEHLDERSDLWSLGAMLYELFAGQAPYCDGPEGRAVGSVLTRYRTGRPTPLVELAPGTPPELVSVIERAMAHDPDQRFASAQELAGEIQAYVDGRVVRSHKTGVWIELRKWVRRNKAAAAGILSGVLVVAGGISAFVWQQRTAAVRIGMERDVAEAERTRAEGLRLAAMAELAQERNPAQALELALRAAELVPGEESTNALYGALRDHRLRDHLVGHEGYVTHGGFAGHDRLVTADSTGLVVVWDTVSGRAVHWLDTAHDAVSAFALDPADRRAAVGYADGTVIVWDLGSGDALTTVPAASGGMPVVDLAWTASDELLAVRASGAAALYDAANGSERATLLPAATAQRFTPRIAQPHAGSPNVVVLDPAGAVHRIDAEQRTVRWSLPLGGRREVHKGPHAYVAVDPQAHALILGLPGEGVRSLAFETGAVLQSLRAPSEGDGPCLLASDGRLFVCVVDSSDDLGRPQQRLVPFARADGATQFERGAPLPWERGDRPLAFSPDDTQLVAGGNEDARVIHLANGREAYPLRGHHYNLNGASFSADGRLIVTLNDDRVVRLWRAVLPGEMRGLVAMRRAGWRELLRTSDAARALVVRSGSKEEGDSLAWVDAATGATAWTASVPPGTAVRDAVYRASTQRFVLALEGAQVLELNARDGSRLAGPLPAVATGVPAEIGAALSSDGTRVVFLTKPPQVIDTSTGERVCALATQGRPVGRPVWSPDGQHVMVTHGPLALVAIYSATSGALEQELRGHVGFTLHAIWLPDGRVATTARDTSVRVWDPTTGRQLAMAAGLSMRGNTIDASFDGSWMSFLSTSIYLIDARQAPQMPLIATLPRDENLQTVRFDGAAPQFVTVGQDGTIRTWQMDAAAQAREVRARGFVDMPTGIQRAAGGDVRLDPHADSHAALAAAEAALAEGRFETALGFLDDAARLRPDWSRLAHARARALALSGHPDEALDALELAARQGWFVLVGARDLANEPAFASLRASPRFEALRAIQRGE